MGKGVFQASEILDITLFICAEDWKQGLQPLVPYIEATFSKVSLIKRIEFIHKVLKVGTETFKDIIRIEKLLTFAEWMYENYKTDEHLEFNPQLKKLLPSGQVDKAKEF